MGELLGFELDLETPVGDMPLSIKQWITIARALLTDPKVLILDKSSAALDFKSTERLFAENARTEESRRQYSHGQSPHRGTGAHRRSRNGAA